MGTWHVGRVCGTWNVRRVYGHVTDGCRVKRVVLHMRHPAFLPHVFDMLPFVEVVVEYTTP